MMCRKRQGWPGTRICALKRKPTLLPDFRPSAAIHARYRAELNALLRSCRNDVLELVREYWEKPVPIAQDNATDILARMIDALMARWVQRLTDLPKMISERMVGETLSAYDKRLGSAMRKAGFTVKLQLTDTTRAAMRASVGMNVGLIKSIPTQYLADVQKYVWESVEGGFDLKTLTDNLDHAYHIGRNRAKLIARDQSNKVHAVMEQARRQELGITKAIWMHSAAAKEPRKSHVAANGKEFDVDKGLYLDGEWVLPGQAINCGCTSRAVIEW